MNLTPVLDVDSNPENPVIGDRSYGSDDEVVSQMGAETIYGYQSGGVAAEGKHFCGHGDIQADSHHGLPVVKKSMKQLAQVELVPFRRAITAQVQVLMTAHVVFEAFNDRQNIPATLSNNVLERLLRHKMAFDGVIMTDCMEMGAISENFFPENAAVRAIKAGADLVLYSHSQFVQKEVHRALTRAIENEVIPPEIVYNSHNRLWRLRKNLSRWTPQAPNDCFLNCPRECRYFLRYVGLRTVRVVSGEGCFTIEGCTDKTPHQRRGDGWEILVPFAAHSSATADKKYLFDDIAARIAGWCPSSSIKRGRKDGELLKAAARNRRLKGVC